MAEWKSNKKIKKVVVNSLITTEFFSFEFDHMPSDEKIKEQILKYVKEKHIPYCVEVSYEEEQKGNFWDAETKEFYSWDELQELTETEKDYKLMESSINGLHNNT